MEDSIQTETKPKPKHLQLVEGHTLGLRRHLGCSSKGFYHFQPFSTPDISWLYKPFMTCQWNALSVRQDLPMCAGASVLSSVDCGTLWTFRWCLYWGLWKWVRSVWSSDTVDRRLLRRDYGSRKVWNCLDSDFRWALNRFLHNVVQLDLC